MPENKSNNKFKIEVVLNIERNKIRISDKILHCVYSSFGETELDTLMECELCRHLPNACLAICEDEEKVCNDNFDNVSITEVLNIDNCVPHSDLIDSDIDSATSQICAIDLSLPSADSFDIDPCLDDCHRKAIQKIIQNDYLDLDNIPATEHNYSMHIRLTSDIPISFSPRPMQLYEHDLQTRSLWRELKVYLEFNCIKSSVSE